MLANPYPMEWSKPRWTYTLWSYANLGTKHLWLDIRPGGDLLWLDTSTVDLRPLKDPLEDLFWPLRYLFWPLKNPLEDLLWPLQDSPENLLWPTCPNISLSTFSNHIHLRKHHSQCYLHSVNLYEKDRQRNLHSGNLHFNLQYR